MRQLDFFPTDRQVGTVYFGGGTPTVLGIDRLCELIQAVRARFPLSDDCEITVEINPAMIDISGLTRLRHAGANRLSVGIQSGNDRVLSLIGRLHTFSQAMECIDDAKTAGFGNISADIIFALPNQSEEEFHRGVCAIADCGVTHISAYSLQIEEGTPFYEKQNELSFPDEIGEEAQYDILCDELSRRGFSQYEISSYARDGYESRHNSGYWFGREYFGFGAGAHSYYNGKRFSTPEDIDAYIESSHTSLLAPTDYESQPFLSEADAEEDKILLGLRTSKGAVIPASAYSTAERIAKLGYGSFDGERLILNRKGFRVSNEIIAEILL